MDDFRKTLQRIDSGKMDPYRDFLSICEKVNPRLGILFVSLITVMPSTMMHWYF